MIDKELYEKARKIAKPIDSDMKEMNEFSIKRVYDAMLLSERRKRNNDAPKKHSKMRFCVNVTVESD